jgi:Fur family ferric uptake transcriptional regulator
VEESAEEILEHHGIKPTANRLMVLRTISDFGCAFSVPDIEMQLPTLDKSTIFRTLTLFKEHHLLHTIDDGSGALKYNICHPDCDGHHSCHLHAHFYCTECHHAYCLEKMSLRVPPLPEGFVFSDMNFVIKGICSDCSSRHAERKNMA